MVKTVWKLVLERDFTSTFRKTLHQKVSQLKKFSTPQLSRGGVLSRPNTLFEQDLHFKKKEDFDDDFGKYDDVDEDKSDLKQLL